MSPIVIKSASVGLGAAILWSLAFGSNLQFAGVDGSLFGMNAGFVGIDREGRFMGEKVIKSDAEWRQHLTPEQYEVARGHGTERAFTGEYWDCHAEGMYVCVCCGQPLFDSNTKFESGTGWPSFFQPTDIEHVSLRTDRTHGMARTEVLCSKCDAHLGHLFDDGPAPTGQRFCMNSAAMRLKPRDGDNTK